MYLIIGTSNENGLMETCKIIRRLVKIFLYLDTMEHVDLAGAEVNVCDALLITEADYSILLEFIKSSEKLIAPKKEAKVTFIEKNRSNVSFFLKW